FRFVPDVTLPQVYVDGCYLADPMRGGRTITSPLEYAQKLKLRNPSVDFLQAFRGLYYEYDPGQSITNHTYSRASIGYQISRDGVLQQLGSGVLCGGHWLGGLHSTLFETAVNNDVTFPEDLSNVAWGKLNATITANKAPAPDQNITADLIVENATLGSHGVASNNFTVTSGDTITCLAFVRDGGRFKGRFYVGGGTSSFGVNYDLTAGTVVPSNVGGTLIASSITI